MSRGLNKVMIIGNLGGDPEIRHTSSGRPVASFSVASSRSWVTSSGERKEATEWFRVVAWGGLAEICKKMLHKGSRVYVEGRLQTRSWENQGQKHVRTEVVAHELVMLEERERPPAQEVEPPSDYYPAAGEEEENSLSGTVSFP